MKRWCLLLLWSGLAWAQAPPDLRVKVTFHTEPAHLQIFSVTEAGVGPLGESQVPLFLHLQPGRKLKLFFAYQAKDPGLEGRQLYTIDPSDLHPLAERDGVVTEARYPATGVLPVQLLPSERALLPEPKPRKRRVWPGLLALLGVTAGVLVLSTRQQRQQQALERAETLLDLSNRLEHRDALTGKKMGAFLIMERLGQGGMATVYRGVPENNLNESQSVAVKVLHANDEQTVERLRREVQVCRDLDHPSIVQFIDAGLEAERFFIVMELIRGETLRSRIESRGISAPQTYRLLKPVMKALEYAHARGVVHRDLKPDNVMIQRQTGRVVLMDFGLARRHDLANVTTTGSLLGTPAYLAPEQVSGQYSAASDQYALGVMAFELLTGQLPFPGTDPLALIMAHVQQTPPTLSSLKPSLPGRLDAVLARMLAKQPEQRYPSLTEVLMDWEAAVPNA